jgi:negative regulator of flagellin synthesis FlgM
MKINTTSPIGGLNGPAGAPGSGVAATRGGQGAKSPADESVHISSLARDLGGQDLEVFDAERIAELKEAISEGRFKVNPEAVADSLLASVREMLLLGRKAP